ncbi:hypothetical protein GobsT_09540 [Gemmata obscuriglobus]|uniref:Uncharacterized protein n=1 Tax=Gemmata obscuriglobus TaxID=114 RepID=A0A2Z3HFG9_9BACT|nr:hypothetical protein [Gemmata obscuriglobus]AWM40534.1 hypothetical protein C1280_28490 [Gemmata obscuriglobus]QEG26215.1 hypothetical protein GobsT_09540 [Gemmata obscuriglobus]VTS00934.1 unnamed protein product [Gemmata obscuriglobus UQM 2246]
MARDLGVYRFEDIVEGPTGSWHVRDGAEDLFDRPLGSESAVRVFWSEPATALGLPLIASVYEYGFYHGVRWSGDQFRAVAAEVDRLEAYWIAAGLPPDTLADLRARAALVRQAVSAAEACGGWVVIT